MQQRHAVQRLVAHQKDYNKFVTALAQNDDKKGDANNKLKYNGYDYGKRFYHHKKCVIQIQ